MRRERWSLSGERYRQTTSICCCRRQPIWLRPSSCSFSKAGLRVDCKRISPELRKRYSGQHMWARGYFCATAGAVTRQRSRPTSRIRSGTKTIRALRSPRLPSLEPALSRGGLEAASAAMPTFSRKRSAAVRQTLQHRAEDALMSLGVDEPSGSRKSLSNRESSHRARWTRTAAG